MPDDILQLEDDGKGGLQIAKPKPAKKPVYSGKTYKLTLNEDEKQKALDEAARSSPEIVNKKYAAPLPQRTQAELETARQARAKADADYAAAAKREARRKELMRKYRTKLPTNEAERSEYMDFVAEQVRMAGIPERELDRDKASAKFVKQLEDANKAEIARAKGAQRADLGLADRFLGKVGAGIDEVATGIYSIPATVFMQTQRDKELASEFLGGYGRSVNELVAENRRRREELEVPDSASTLEKTVGIAGDVAGQLIPTIALASTGIGAPIAAAATGTTSSIGAGQPEEAAVEGFFGALGAGAGMLSEELAAGAAIKLFGRNTLMSNLARQLTGRSLTAGSGAVVSEIENIVRALPDKDAKVNLLTGAILDGIFYGGKRPRRGKDSGLMPTYQRALDTVTPGTEAFEIQRLQENIKTIPAGPGLFEVVDHFTNNKNYKNITPEDRLRNLNDFLSESKVKREDGSPIELYHGTSSAAEISAINPAKFDSEGAYGPGFYMTQNPQVASGYTNKQGGAAATSFGGRVEIQEAQKQIANLRFLESTAQSPAEVEGIQQRIAEAQGELDKLIRANSYKPTVYKIYADIRNPFDVDAIIDGEEAGRLVGLATGQREIREQITGGQLYEDVLLPLVGDRAQVNDLLERAGYDGITHTSGRLTGDNPVNVFADQGEAQGFADKVGGRVIAGQNAEGLPSYAVDGHKVWIAFKPEAIKSATGNVGSYTRGTTEISRKALQDLRERKADLEATVARFSDLLPQFQEEADAVANLETPALNAYLAKVTEENKDYDLADYQSDLQGLSQAIDDPEERAFLQQTTDRYGVNVDALLRDVEAVLDQQAKQFRAGDAEARLHNAYYELDQINSTLNSRKGKWSKAEKDIHEHWGVPKWLPGQDDSTILEHLHEARYDTRIVGDTSRVYTNSAGAGIVAALSESMTLSGRVSFERIVDSLVRGERFHNHGINIPVPWLEEMLDTVRQVSDEDFAPVITDLRRVLAGALQNAEKLNLKTVQFYNLDAPELGTTILHEGIHGIHKSHELTNDLFVFENLTDFPNQDKITEALDGLHYNIDNPLEVTSEAFAYLGSGDFTALGLTAEEGAQTFSAMLRHAAETMGVREVAKFRFSPKLKEAINDTARRYYRAQQSARATLRDAESGTSISGRPSEWFRQRGTSSTGDVSSGVSFSRQPWENVDTSFDPPTWRDKVRQVFENKGIGTISWGFLDKLKSEALDDMWAAIKTWQHLTQGQNISPGQDAQMLMRLWLGGNRKVDTVLRNGMIDGQGRYVTPDGFHHLFEPFAGLDKDVREADMQATIYLMVAQRTLELATKKMASPLSNIPINRALTGIGGDQPGAGLPNDPLHRDVTVAIRQLTNVANMGDPDRIARIEEAARRYRQWADSLLDYYEEKGRISPTKANELRRSNQFYVDLHRMFDDNPDAVLDSSPKKILAVKKLFRDFKGGKFDISNPYLNLMIATDQVIREADRNEVLNTFIDPLRTQLLNQNLGNAQRAELEMIAKKVNDATKDSTKIWNNGLEEHWELHPELQAAFENWRNIPSGIVSNAITLPFRLLRTAIVHSPGFIARNFLRDSQARTIMSRVFATPKDAVNPVSGSAPWDGVPELFKSPSLRNRQALWLMGGGQAGNYLSSRIDYQARLVEALREVADDRSVILTSANKIGNFLFKTLPKQAEDANRQAEFKAQVKYNRSLGMTEYDAQIKAAYESRDMLDFAVAGKTIRAINKYVLFLNPGVQGLRRELGGARERPLPFLMRWGMYALIPAMAELTFNQQQGEEVFEQWRQLPAWRKDFFYNLHIGDGKWSWITIPKPFTLGLAASGINRMIDRAYFKNDRAFEDFGGSVWRAASPVDESAFLGPLKTYAEMWSNYSIFYDDHIVSPYEENRDPSLLGERGTATGRAASKALNATLGQVFEKFSNVDPRYMDYWFRSQFSDYGLTAQYVGELLNAELTGDAKTKSDISWRLAKLAAGNIIRDSKPDQARDVKKVTKAAIENFGDRSEWFTPIKEAIQKFRESNDPAERHELTMDAIYAAQVVRPLLPEYHADMLQAKQEVDSVTSLNPAFKGLDKHSQLVVKSALTSELRQLVNELMSAKVSGSEEKMADAREARAELDLKAIMEDEIEKVLDDKQELIEQRREEPLIPPRPQRQ